MSSLQFINDPDVTPEDAAKIINALAKPGVSGQISAGAAAVVGAAIKADPSLSTIALLGFGVPLIVAPSGSVAANGALTLGTALALTYPNAFVYFPAGAVFSGSAAGFYYVEMSSTTAGTVFANIYSPVVAGPAIPASPTPIVAAGPGAFTGEAAEVVAAYVTVRGGLMRKNGRIDFAFIGSFNNSAGSKIYSLHIGGTQAHSSSGTTQQSIAVPKYLIQNRGRVDRQISSGQVTNGTSSAAPVQTSVNTAADFVVEIRMRHSTATDAIALESANITMDVGDA